MHRHRRAQRRAGAIALAGAELQVSDDSAVTRFLRAFLEGTGPYFAGEFETAAPRLRDAVEIADDADVEASAQLPDLLLLAGGAALFLGDDTAAERFNRRLATRARDLGALSLLNEILPRVALGQVASGKWQAAMLPPSLSLPWTSPSVRRVAYSNGLEI